MGKDAAFTLMAYNQLKQRMLMLNGVGLGDAEMKKVQLIKRLTNQGHNLQVMGVNSIREFLVSERDREEREREEFERQQKEQNPKKNYERQPKSYGSWIQTSPTMDCLCQRC